MAGDTTLDHNDLGLAGSLFDGCLNLFITLRKIAYGSQVLSEIQDKLLSKQLEQLLLWGDGFGASKGDLDAVLIQPDSSHLNTLILQLLGAIGHTLIDKFMAILKPGSPIDNQLGEQQALVTGLLEKADYISLGELYDSDSSDSESKASSVDIPGIAVDDFITDLTTYVQSLADTIPALERAASQPHPQPLTITTETTRPLDFNVSDVAKPYCRKINDKYPKASLVLVERLGEANAERHRRIREGFDESVVDTENKHDRAKTEAGTTFYDSALGPSIVSNENDDDGAPFYPPQSTSAMSEATFTSLFTDEGNTSLRVPPLPKEALEGESFVCVVCKRLIDNVSNRIDQKKHVFKDLKPYVCTFSACPCKSMFSSRRAWWAHETDVHRVDVTWSCKHCPEAFKEELQFDTHRHAIDEDQAAHSSANKLSAASKTYQAQNFEEQVCPLCFDFAGSTSSRFAKHVAKHMEEIALAVVPHDADDADASDSERNSESGSKVHEEYEGGGSSRYPSAEKDFLFLAHQKTPPNPSGHQSASTRNPVPCSHCPLLFPSESTLKKHILSSHTRPFICPFQRYGCNDTLGSKNGWKRHITVQHLHLEVWRCDLDNCAFPTREETREEKYHDFDRKDLFTQHIKRMHAPPNSASQSEKAAFDARIPTIQDRCHRHLRSPPPRSRCPYCPDKFFDGVGSLTDRLEHVGNHLEKNDFDKKDEVEDEDLRNWMVHHGFMEWKNQTGYRLTDSERKKKQKNKPVVITSENEENTEGEDEDIA